MACYFYILTITGVLPILVSIPLLIEETWNRNPSSRLDTQNKLYKMFSTFLPKPNQVESVGCLSRTSFGRSEEIHVVDYFHQQR